MAGSRAELPGPDDVLPALLRRLRGTGHAPLAVLDDEWSAPLRADATAAVQRGVDDGRVGPDDLVLFTSGSSGRARGVVRTVASWVASLDPLTELTGVTADDLVWLPLPLSSGLSLYGGFHAGATGAAVRADAGPLPLDVTVAHLVPGLLERAVTAAESGAPHRLRVVVVAGAALPTTLRQRAERLGWLVVEYYGAAELSFVGVRTAAGPMTDFPGATTRRGDDGTLWVRSPYLARGYLDDAPGAALRRDGAWASVGDRARALDGGWRVLGRGDAAVQTGGATVVAEEVEAAVLALPGVEDVAVLGLPHPELGQVVAAVVVVRPGVVRADLDRALHHLPPVARPRRWLVAAELPRTRGGKLARAEVVATAAGLPPLA